jgi:hypothetical protein
MKKLIQLGVTGLVDVYGVSLWVSRMRNRRNHEHNQRNLGMFTQR